MTTTATTITQAAATRTAGFAELKEKRDEINQAFADEVRSMIDAGEETVTSAAEKANLSRQVMHDILRRYPASA